MEGLEKRKMNKNGNVYKWVSVVLKTALYVEFYQGKNKCF